MTNNKLTSIFAYIKRYWKHNLILITIITCGALSSIATNVLNASLLDTLVNNDKQQFIWTLLITAGVWTAFLIFLYLKIRYKSVVVQKMATAIRDDIAELMTKSTYQSFHSKEAGAYASWMTNDLSAVETNGFEMFYVLFELVIEMIGGLIALYFFHWSFIVYSVVVGVIIVFLPLLVKKSAMTVIEKLTLGQEKFLSSMTNILQGYDTLLSFNLLSVLAKRTHEASTKLATEKNNHQRMVAKISTISSTGNVYGQLGITALTIFLAFSGIVSVGAVAATSRLAGSVFNSVANLTNGAMEITLIKPIFDKFRSINTTKPSDYEAFTSDVSQPALQLNNLSYCYEDKTILSGLDAQFCLGGKYAIVGPSGSGKSTLLNILSGKLTDYTGSAKLLGNEINCVHGEDLRQEIIYLDQTPYIFEGTIRENIEIGESFNDAQLDETLEASDLKSVIAGLTDGLDTLIDEGGRSLSGGQKQRIALARGLIRGRRIILLDEGTSSLDHESALHIEKKLMNNADLTVIMVTHHLRAEIAEHLDNTITLQKA